MEGVLRVPVDHTVQVVGVEGVHDLLDEAAPILI
jgi:hypothetical protein